MRGKTNILIIFLSIFFVLFSFIPNFYEYQMRDKIPKDRYFTLEHNYNFDYNFYLSRIKEGSEGRWLVTEKYYNHPHNASLFQIIYLYLGKTGSLFGLSETAIYHFSRMIFGLILLLAVARFGRNFFQEKGLILFFMLSVTAGSWPILVRAGDFWRFATYYGNWSVIDSLSRITIMPHILVGQIFLVLLVIKLSSDKNLTFAQTFLWGSVSLFAGILFPPTLIIIFAYLAVLSAFELLDIISQKHGVNEKKNILGKWLKDSILKKGVVILLALPALIYAKIMFGTDPWKAISLFDIEHRIPLLYMEYIKALGPILILGIGGIIMAFIRQERKYYPAIAWIVSIVLLFAVFENIPEQSPLRFTEGLIHVPLAVFATFFLTRIRFGKLVSAVTIFLGLTVMASMVLWLTDQAYSKRFGTWAVPLGAQHAYPIRDFMDGIFYLRDNTKTDEVVLGYISSGNYIPPYAGNYVYIGHANTPDEDEKEKIVASFF